MTRILGIDPGSRKTGFGIVETDGKRTHYVTSGVIKLPVNEPLAARLKVLAESLDQIISEYQPTLAVIEQVFMAKSADSALKLGQARGAAMVVCALADLEVHEYATRQIKQAVVGTGGA
ncbi:MAG: crossover junction endodeoxyribonuclease RuvC, partial [Pseudomonadota bacterium]|nr:crossover junction endodeoxyribonuclease RuvC [Pseudomonadota bacterium]